jgi:hypothetical protein
LTGGTRNYFDERKKTILIKEKTAILMKVKKLFLRTSLKRQKRKINIKKLIKNAFIKKYL